MSKSETLELLSAVFPNISKDELRTKLETFEKTENHKVLNVDKLIETLLVEIETLELQQQVKDQTDWEEYVQASTSTSMNANSSNNIGNNDDNNGHNGTKHYYYSSNSLKLIEMFPNHDVDQLERALIDSKDDFDGAIALILNDHELTNDNIEVDNDSIGNRDIQADKDDWHIFDSQLEKLAKLVQLPKSAVTKSFYATNGNIAKCLIDMVHNYQAQVEKEKRERKDGKEHDWIDVKSRPVRGGRVQRGGGGGRRRGHHREDVSDHKEESSKLVPKETVDVELIEEVSANLCNNPSFKSMQRSFIYSTVELVKGDFEKAIKILTLIHEDNGMDQLTSCVRLKFNLSPYKSTLPNQSEAEKKKDLDDNIELGLVTVQPRLNQITQHLDLDLHRLSIQEAKAVSRIQLEKWWDTELQMRIDHGQFNKYGNRVEFVHELNIITGRGNHSDQGISVVKNSVGKLLVNDNYIYEERLGSYIVMGKRLNAIEG
ncbi:uncharacterized protein RJT21DRAFT_3469 [Scheffersomyces amazonensis]|uniref:uncharacterized protein n=1 Tax=Scheffersomyces amazonensis TaxID=1078765 RepID=UPI00315D274C